MNLYYKGTLLNKNKSPITNGNSNGLEFSNGSQIIIDHKSIISDCSGGIIKTNGSNKDIFKTINIPEGFSDHIYTIQQGLLMPREIRYYLSNDQKPNNPSGYLTGNIVKSECQYINIGPDSDDSPGIYIDIGLSNIPENAVKIIAYFTYLFIIN